MIIGWCGGYDSDHIGRPKETTRNIKSRAATLLTVLNTRPP